MEYVKRAEDAYGYLALAPEADPQARVVGYEANSGFLLSFDAALPAGCRG